MSISLSSNLNEAENNSLSMGIPNNTKQRVVVIGGGFGGIEFAKLLGDKEKYQIVLIDRHNYHTFQPLLYQVATAGLEPDSIAAPLRKVFKGYKDFYFRMTDVLKIVPEENVVYTTIGNINYDFLVIATGSKTNYYGNNELKEKAFPLKQIPHALDLRSKILQNFEISLLKNDPMEFNSYMDIVIVGGGPTGVEVAGALSELKKYVLPKDLPELDLSKMDIYLIEAGKRLLNGMSDKAGKKSLQYLESFGVKVKLGIGVKSYDGYKVILTTGEEIISRTVIWAAGVTGNVLEGIKPEVIKGGRITVDKFNYVTGYNNIFAIGDIAGMYDEVLAKGHPMVAQVAIQQGKNLAKNLLLDENKTWKPFNYHDKGSMATVGRNRAVVDFPNFSVSGIFAWFIWMFVHLLFLIGFRNKITTFINWVWNYFTFDRATRLIIRPWKSDMANDREE